ncbi:MAG: hypothetical protein JRJ69_06295 [Deltaproteobacteria bacterium]|nr:hypothetical protein [Deltaproteobacteria bacterium]
MTTTLSGFDFKINLFHVIKGGGKVKTPYLFLSKENIENVGRTDKSVFDDAIHRLTEAGFKLNQINTQIVSGAQNISSAI